MKRGISAVVESMGYDAITNDLIDLSEAFDLVIGLFDDGTDPLLSHVPDALKHSNVLLVGGDFGRTDVNGLISQGVKTIVTKDCSGEEIENAIKFALRGGRFYCSRVLETLTRMAPAAGDLVGKLTPREREVLKLVLEGHTSQDCSDKLFVSLHTINSHRKNILRKFELKSPTELFLFAIDNELLKYL